MSTFKTFLQFIKWWFYWYPFRFVVQKLPLSLNYKAANSIVPIVYLLLRGDRKRIGDGVSMMFGNSIPSEKKKEYVKGTFKNILHSAVEVLWYPKLTKEICGALFAISGKGNIDRAVAAGRGTVLLHGHYGNPHLIMPSIGHEGYKLSQVASRKAPERSPGLFGSMLYKVRTRAYEAKLKYKESLPVNFIYTDSSIREVFRRLQKNELVAIGMDGREGTNGVEFDFLSGRAEFYTGAMRILRKARPTILPVFHVRKRDNTHMIVVEEPFNLEITDNEENDAINNTERFLKIFECYIFKHPDHYARVFCLRPPFILPAVKR